MVYFLKDVIIVDLCFVGNGRVTRRYYRLFQFGAGEACTLMCQQCQVKTGELQVAVLQMYPDMDVAQWLLVTLTAGVGGSLLSIGSAAGVALMGQARGQYTFFSHLKWTPAIALGFALSIWVHFLVNGGYVGVSPG